MKTTRLLFIALVTGLLAPAGRAADGPTVDSILSKFVTAMGGKAAIEKVTSRVTKFKIDTQAIGSSEGELFAKAPNKQVSNIEITGAGAMKEGFDGTVAWALSPWEGLRLKTGDELAKVKRDAEFYRELKMKSLYPDLAYTGMEKIGDEETCILEAKPTATSTEKFWFSTKTGLVVRQESSLQGPQGKVQTAVTPKEYKTIDGIKYPGEINLKLSFGDQKMEFNMKFLEIKHNVPIEDSKFAKPSA